MPLDPTLPLQIAQASQPQDPLAQYGKVLALKNALQQGQMGQQQLQEGQLELATKQRDFTGQQALSDAIQKNLTSGPDGTPTIDHAGVTQALGASGQGRLIPSYMTGVLAQQKAQADARKLQLENAASSLDLATRQFGAANDQSSWDAALATAHGLGIDTTKQGIPGQFSPAAQATVQAMGMTVKEKLAAATAALEAQSRAKEATASSARNQTEADKAAFELKLQQGAMAGTGESAITDRFRDNPAAQAAALQAWRQNLPAGIKTATDEVNKVYDNTIGAPSKITAETPAKVAQERQLIPVKAATAGAEAAASEPIRARAQADAQAYLMQKVGGPLAGVLDPGERAKITNDYLTANNAYAERAADAQRLKEFVAAARTGNQSASGLMTISELRSAVNRINTTEIQQAGGGSLVRSITNKLDKGGTGVPSEDTLKELEQVADLNEKTARGGFAQKVRAINRISNAKLDEAPPNAAQAAPASSGWKVIKVE